MACTFEGSLQTICNNILLSKEDRISYTSDAEKIKNFLIGLMKHNNLEFAQAFKGLSLTGSYLDDLKINKPDEFDMHIKLEFPGVTLTPQRCPQPAFLQLQTRQYHHLVIDGCVSRDKLQDWVRDILNQVFSKNYNIYCSTEGRTYKMEYKKKGQAVAHTILATDSKDGSREISFDFVPVFEFKPQMWCFPSKHRIDRSWFAVPPKRYREQDECAFMVCAPHWEHEILKDKVNLKNSLRLMKTLRNGNDLGRLSSYMLKSVYLIEIERNFDWSQSLGAIFMHMLLLLLECVQECKIPFFWDRNLNHLNLLDRKLCQKYQGQLRYLYCELQKLQQQRSVAYKDVEKLFKSS